MRGSTEKNDNGPNYVLWGAAHKHIDYSEIVKILVNYVYDEVQSHLNTTERKKELL